MDFPQHVLSVTDPTVSRDTLADFVSFNCDISNIHGYLKKAAMRSVDDDAIDYLFHDSNIRNGVSKQYHGNGTLQSFIGCHTIIAVFNKGFHDTIDIDKARREVGHVNSVVESDDTVMNWIFSDCIRERFPTIWNERHQYAEAYYNVLVNNNFVIAELEEYKPSSDVLVQKSDLLAFIFAKLRVLDSNNEFYPKAKEFYNHLFSQYPVHNQWQFAKVSVFNSDNLSHDLEYAMHHLQHMRFVPPRGFANINDMLNNLSHNPFKSYLKPKDDDCVIL
jgi:hypothetical protein